MAILHSNKNITQLMLMSNSSVIITAIHQYVSLFHPDFKGHKCVEEVITCTVRTMEGIQ